MTAANRINKIILLLSFVGGIVLLFYCHSSERTGKHLIKVSTINTLLDYVEHVNSELPRKNITANEIIMTNDDRYAFGTHTQEAVSLRSLLRTNNNDVSSRQLQQVMPYGMNNNLNDGITKGLSNLGLFLMGWMIIICVVGGAMRCFLCCEFMQNNPNYNLQNLYNSFIGRDDCYENNEEGIALESFRDENGIATH